MLLKPAMYLPHGGGGPGVVDRDGFGPRRSLRGRSWQALYLLDWGVMRRLRRRYEVDDGADGARPNLIFCERLGQSSVDADLRTGMRVNKT
jgi:hypothetical protein